MAMVLIFITKSCSKKYLKYPKAFSCKGSSSFNKRMKKLVSNSTQFCSIRQALLLY